MESGEPPDEEPRQVGGRLLGIRCAIALTDLRSAAAALADLRERAERAEARALEAVKRAEFLAEMSGGDQ